MKQCLCSGDPDYHSELISFIGRGTTESLYLFRLQHGALYHLPDGGGILIYMYSVCVFHVIKFLLTELGQHDLNILCELNVFVDFRGLAHYISIWWVIDGSTD